MKYHEWLKEWHENYIEPTAKTRTFSRYSEIIKQHIIPRLGDYELDEITPGVLQHYITELLQSGNLKTGKGLSANSVGGIINVVQNSLRTAFNLGYVKEFTADRIKRPKAQEKAVNCFTAQEQKQIEQAVLNSKKDKMFGILLCLYTGLRVGELLALKWEDIDLQKGILTVSKSCHDGKDRFGHYVRFEDTPKTSSSRRVIPLPRQLLPLIKVGVCRFKKCKPAFCQIVSTQFRFVAEKIKNPPQGISLTSAHFRNTRVGVRYGC